MARAGGVEQLDVILLTDGGRVEEWSVGGAAVDVVFGADSGRENVDGVGEAEISEDGDNRRADDCLGDGQQIVKGCCCRCWSASGCC
jgi:hypothetical protein